MVDLSAAPVGAELLLDVGDFYLLDDTRVAVMRYDSSRAFLRADLVEDPVATIYRATASAAWAMGQPFDDWWSRHPEHHHSVGAR